MIKFILAISLYSCILYGNIALQNINYEIITYCNNGFIDSISTYNEKDERVSLKIYINNKIDFEVIFKDDVVVDEIDYNYQ